MRSLTTARSRRARALLVAAVRGGVLRERRRRPAPARRRRRDAPPSPAIPRRRPDRRTRRCAPASSACASPARTGTRARRGRSRRRGRGRSPGSSCRASTSSPPRPRSATTCSSRRRSSAARRARSPASSLVDQEGPLALVEVDDPAFWEGLEPLPLAKDAPGRGDAHDPPLAARGAPRLVPRHACARCAPAATASRRRRLLTLEVATGAEGLGESEVVIADGQRRGPRDRPRRRRVRRDRRARCSRQFLDGRGEGRLARLRARRASRGRTSRTRRCARRSASRPGETRRPPDARRAERQRGRRAAPGRRAARARRGEARPAPAATSTRSTGGCSFALLFTDGRRPGRHAAGQGAARRPAARRAAARCKPHAAGAGEGARPTSSAAGPGYVVVGGLVFQELTRPYLGAWGDWTRRAPPRLLVALDREAAVPDAERAAHRAPLERPARRRQPRLPGPARPDRRARSTAGAVGSLDDLRAGRSRPAGRLPRRRAAGRPGRRARRDRRRRGPRRRGPAPRGLRRRADRTPPEAAGGPGSH